MYDVNDFKLVPLHSLVHDEALLDSYKDFVASMKDHYEDIDHGDIGEDVDSFEDRLMEDLCAFYTDQRSGQDLVEEMLYTLPNGSGVHVLVSKNHNVVLGQTLNVVNNEAGVNVASGFDLIAPRYRGEGLGKIIMAHRLALLSDGGAEFYDVSIREDNISSLKRLNRLRNAFLVVSEEAKDGNVHARVALKGDASSYCGVLSDYKEPDEDFTP